jgi:2'-5' RNA ligase
MRVYVIALEFERKLNELIYEQKKEIEFIAGNQIYLNHPPHITLYVLSSNQSDLIEIKKRVKKISEYIKIINIKIKGLGIFKNDSKTKCDTVFYEFMNDDELIKIQKEIVILSDLDQSTEKFNFIGGEWHPHITLASIQEDKLEYIYKKLKNKEINGDFIIDKLVIYSYKYPSPPRIIKKFRLKNA